MQPYVVYKYFTERRFAEGLLENGSMRIGHVEEYRNYEEADKARRDASDAALTGSLFITDSDNEKGLPFHKSFWLKQLGIELGPNARYATIDENTISASDCYLYCTSLVRSREIARDFNASYCVAIRNPARFMRRVCRALSAKGYVRRGMASQVVYMKDVEDYEKYGPVPTEFIKPEEFAHQQEYRFAWQPVSTAMPLSPVFIEVPRVVELCSMVKIEALVGFRGGRAEGCRQARWAVEVEASSQPRCRSCQPW